MSDEIKVDYALMDEMSETFDRAVAQLETTMNEMVSIAATLEEGALWGRGGQAFSEMLRGEVTNALTALIDKHKELAADVREAKAFAQQADRTAEGHFSGS